MSAHADHEARLRAVLHAAADSLEPHGDGLERIRARLRQPRPTALAWASAVSAELFMRAPAWLQDAVYRMADWLRLAAERFAPAQASGRHRSRAQGLLRPLAAMAVVMFIVAAGTYVAIDASTAIFPSSSSSQPGGSAPNAGPHSGAAGPAASRPNGTQSAAGSGSKRPTPAPSASCTPAGSGATTTPAAAQTSSTSTSTPAPTDSATSDTTDSASPGDTTSDSPSTDSPAPSASPSVEQPAPPAGSPTPTPVLTKPC